MVNISHDGPVGDMVWCPGWNGMATFNFGGDSEFQIKGENPDASLVFKREAVRIVTPVMSAVPPPSWGDANATCLIVATNGVLGCTLQQAARANLGIDRFRATRQPLLAQLSGLLLASWGFMPPA